MKREDISFENMTEKLLEAIPELRAFHDRALALNEDDGVWSGQHITYEEVVSKRIKELLRLEKPDEHLLRKIFDFCPKCEVDAVLGTASGFPISATFLKAMKDRWL